MHDVPGAAGSSLATAGGHADIEFTANAKTRARDKACLRTRLATTKAADGLQKWEKVSRNANDGGVQFASMLSTLQRVAPYVAVWLALVLIVALTPLSAVWHAADFSYLQNVLHLGESLVPDRDLAIVDLDVRPANAQDLRRREIGLLDAISANAGFSHASSAATLSHSACERAAAHRGRRDENASEAPALPAAIIFDIAFTSETSTRQPDCVAPLVAEIAQLRKAGVKIYAAQDLENANGGGSITGRFEIDPNFQENQDQRIYDQLSRSGHTLITSDPYLPGGALFYYPKALVIPAPAGGEGSTSSCALAIVAVGRADDVCLPIVARGGEEREGDQQIVTVGSSAAFARTTQRYDDAIRSTDAFGNRFVLLGDAAIDTAAGDPRSKFEILSWAVNQSVADARGRPAAHVLIDTRLMLGISATGALIALGVFLAVTRVFRKRSLRFALATALAMAVPVALLAIVDAVLRSYDLLYSELTFPFFAIVVTAGIALWAGIAAVRRDLFVTQLQQHETAVVEKYDVFISYARTAENTKWVEDNVLAPLSKVTRPDGKPLRIFFDRQSIKIGYAWYTTLVEAVYGSRYFVPIYSDGYFERPFCRDELDIAMLRQVGADAFILPLSRSADTVPPRYARVQFVDVVREPAFMESVIAVVTRD